MKEKDFISSLKIKIPFTINGFINPTLPWYSPNDLAKCIGKSRQYWCKIIKQGKLKSNKTSAGPIVTTEQLMEYYGLIS